MKYWIIGDSFASTNEKTSWVEISLKHFKDDDYYVSSMGSRDIQTIFDIFLQNLHKIKPDDFVILILPTLTRFRLPLETPHLDIHMSNEHDMNINSDWKNITNGMIGNSMYSSNITNTPKEKDKEHFLKTITLEFPLSTIDPMIFEANASEDEPNFANIMQMINSSKAFTNNWNGILKSIQSYVPFKLLYYSWANELDSSVVNTRSVLTNQLGIWETLNDEYNKTNGQSGRKDDIHWSRDMNMKFAQHIIKSYPQYFGYESKIL